jgi:hypothetical protein
MRPTSIGFHTCWLMRNVQLAQMYDKHKYTENGYVIYNAVDIE